MWYVYIVKCNDGTYYTGISEDVEERVRQHNLGRGSKYLKERLPVSLVYKKKFEAKSLARCREIEIKKHGRKNKEKLIFQYQLRMRSLVPSS